MYDLISNPSTKAVYARYSDRLIGLSGQALPLWSNTDSWPTVGHIESFAKWKKDPGAFGPTNALALIELPTGRCLTVGGNVLAILGYIEDMQAELIRWANAYNCRNAARAAAEVAV